MGTRNRHWDDVYSRKAPDAVSWFQPNLNTSLKLIRELELPRNAGIIDVGAGTSTLVDDLLEDGFDNVSVLDISVEALETTKQRLGSRAQDVTWIHGDVTKLELGQDGYDLWHDRAVFHFLTREADRQRYVALAERALKPGAHIIVATFGLAGPEQCSGLDVVRYDPELLHAQFGSSFVKIGQVEEVHETPWGADQEFVYCYCRRSSDA